MPAQTKEKPVAAHTLKIFIADDHPIVREGLKQIIAKTPDMVVVGEAADGHEVLSRIRTSPVDIVVLDISMPGRSGLDVLKQLKAQSAKLRLLVLSQHPEEEYALRVLRAGASGYLTKESASEQLITALRKVASGGRYVSPALAERLAAELDTPADKPLHGTLSDREYEVMRMIAAGRTVSEIGEELSLSVKTISTYRTRILAKMNLTRNADIIHYGIRNGLVENATSAAPARKTRKK